jgi:hypothetical protein
VELRASAVYIMGNKMARMKSESARESIPTMRIKRVRNGSQEKTRRHRGGDSQFFTMVYHLGQSMKHFSILLILLPFLFCCISQTRKTTANDSKGFFTSIVTLIVDNKNIPEDQFEDPALSKTYLNKTGIDSIRPIIVCKKIGQSKSISTNEYSYIFKFEGEKGYRLIDISIFNKGNIWKVKSINRIVKFYGLKPKRSF